MLFSYLWGSLVLGEQISAMGVAGSLLVAVGVVAVSHKGRQKNCSPGLQEHAHMPLARQEGEAQQPGDAAAGPGPGAQGQGQQLGPEDSSQEVGLGVFSDEFSEGGGGDGDDEGDDVDLRVSPGGDEPGWKPGGRFSGGGAAGTAAGQAGVGPRQGAGGGAQAMVVRADGASSAGSSIVELQVLPPTSPDWGPGRR